MSSINITPPPLSPQAMADLLCTVMLLCRGNDHYGKPFWAYMCIKPSMAQSFQEAREKGKFNLEDYGTVLETGPGHDVPTEVATRMERDYGVNHHFEEDIIRLLDGMKKKSA